MFSIMFAVGSRAVCPSCKRPLWRCLCRLPYSLLCDAYLFTSNLDVTETDYEIFGAGVLQRRKGLKEGRRSTRELLRHWTLEPRVFGLCDRLRLRGRAGGVALSVSRGMLSWTFRADGWVSLSSRLEDKADGKTESL